MNDINCLNFEQVVDDCLSAKKGSLKRSTYIQYRCQCSGHLLKEFGCRPFSSLTEKELNDYLRSLVEDGYQNSTVLNIRTILMMVIRYAHQTGIPSTIQGPLFIPCYRHKEMHVFTRREQKQIDSILKEIQDPYVLAVYLALYCGLRIGEVCALQWQDINMRNGTISVSKTLHRLQDPDSSEAKTQIITELPKTHNSIRTIPIPAFLMPILRTYRAPGKYFVITGKETCMEPRTCLRRYKTICRKAHVSDYSFHTLRHTFATRCIELGMDTKSLSEILGHASVKVTLDRYVHPSMDFKKTQMNRLKKVFVIDEE